MQFYEELKNLKPKTWGKLPLNIDHVYCANTNYNFYTL